MGSGRWTTQDWDTYQTTHVAGKSQAQAFTSQSKLAEFDPAKIAVRESRDSADNPNSTPVILASDVTGSMGVTAEVILRDGLNKVMSEILDKKPIPDPHLMVMAVGDTKCDVAGLQVTQFEADLRIAQQTQRLWIEGNGGGNGGESYSAAHLFAAMKTSIDCYEKRGRKGFLFTMGDEPIHDGMTKAEIRDYLGIEVERDLSAREIMTMVQRKYEVFHIVVNEGYSGYGLNRVLATWKPLLPERTLILEAIDKLPEVVVSAIRLTAGHSMDDVMGTWDASTALVVANAVKGLPAGYGGNGGGLRRLA